jgi:hypothetical protein
MGFRGFYHDPNVSEGVIKVRSNLLRAGMIRESAFVRAGMIRESAFVRALLRASSLWLPLQLCPSLWLSELEGERSLLALELELELEIACVMMLC